MLKTLSATTLSLLLFSLFSLPSLAKAQSAHIGIVVENAALKRHYFEVKDRICATEPSNDCRVAELLADSAECENRRQADECRKAREISTGAGCEAGILFFGWLDPGERVELQICADHTGKGRVATRNSETAPWVQHHWVEAGETIEVR